VKVGIVVFPGSNCDHDTYHVLKHVVGQEARFVWHKESDLGGLDAVVLPGGFSYGDYLRTGAIAAHSPIMAEVKRAASRGVHVLGICNGFQILTEAGLLPGVLQRNAALKFVCREVGLKVETSNSPFTRAYNAGQVLRVPVAHGDGNYFADDDTVKRLEDEDRIAFRYEAVNGEATERVNPNGSRAGIAGVLDASRRTLGLMPHPENAIEPMLGSTDGRGLFASLVQTLS